MTAPNEPLVSVSHIAKLRSIIAQNEQSLFEMYPAKLSGRKERGCRKTARGRIVFNLP